MHPRDERIATIAASIIRLIDQNRTPSPRDVARISGFTVGRVEKHWGEAVSIARAQRRTSDAKPR